ncbi:MAG: TIGR00730 family Rossman fold protein [Bacteroidaceae bacterium]|nr:TIGR00730 family Rossman fold protein [Bacteroidaceae bacterium]
MSFSVFRATSENTDDKVLQVSEELFTLHRKSVCVYCASSTQIDEKYFRAAEELGSLIAQNGLRLITGAGKLGLMNTIQDAALAAGGEAVGVIPTFMVNEGWHHEGLTQLIETASMHERKQTMADLSNGIIALPGGCGTMEELLEIITWKQLGLYLNPIVILNIDGYYDALLAQLATAVEENFMRSIHADIWSVATTPKEAIELLLNTPKWDKNIRKFAAI